MSGSSAQCRWCKEENPAKANFCMYCGKKIGTVDKTVWKSEHLEINREASLTLLRNALLERFGKLPPNFQFKELTMEAVVAAFEELTDKQQQVLIRRANLALKGRKSYKEIASEMGTRIKSVKRLEQWAVVNLWNNLMVLKEIETVPLNPSLAAAMEEANKRISEA